MPSVRLIHWKGSEVGRYRAALETAGYDVHYDDAGGGELLRLCRELPVDLFLIDLTRLPSHGREVAAALLQSKATRTIPIVFCDGEEAKVAKTRELLPDAAFCQFSGLKSTLRRMLKSPPKTPAVPVPMMERYGSRSAAQKLGIVAGSAVRVVNAPRDFPGCLGELPDGVEFLEDSGAAAVTLCFADEVDTLQQTISDLRRAARTSKLWVCWKKGKAAQRGVSERLVRETGISLGLVDYKICSVNEVWSALLFAARAEK